MSLAESSPTCPAISPNSAGGLAARPTLFPLRSAMLRIPSLANNSKQPTWMPATRDRFADVDPGEEEYWKIQSEIDFASGDCSGKVVCRRIHITHIGKAFGSQQLIRDIERRLADREVLRNPDCGRTPRCPASGTCHQYTAIWE